MAPNSDRFRAISAALLALLFVVSCSALPVRTSRPKGIYHRVQKGETLWHIAHLYRVNLQDLAEINDIGDPARIEADSVVFIPDPQPVQDDVSSTLKSRETDDRAEASRPEKAAQAASRPLSDREGIQQAPPGTAEEPIRDGKTAGAAAASRAQTARTDTKAAPLKERPGAAKAQTAPSPERGPVDRSPSLRQEAPRPAPAPAEADRPSLQFDRKRFSWPVDGKVASRFGIQSNGMFSNGIKIVAPQGTAVKSAAAGTVIYSSVLKGYGETIIVRHEDHYATVYTDLGSRLVRLDEQIKRGDRIAFMGVPGKAGDAFMMFEVRYRNKARNPLFFLP
ncbi:MAG TPA: M23 family metallopeptidase [Syntrophales bacterium]|nr:M23 family metallopeptidase [Syntrophales bacterium]